MKQPLMLQSDCVDCKHYEGFGQCYYHGNDLIENCIDYQKEQSYESKRSTREIICKCGRCYP